MAVSVDPPTHLVSGCEGRRTPSHWGRRGPVTSGRKSTAPGSIELVIQKRLAAVALALGLAAVGCGSTTQPPPPATSPVSGASAPPQAGTTETDWGTIHDALPPGFPRYPGSTPTETGAGPASAVFDVPADLSTVTTWFQGALEGAGFSTLSLSGPAEDGSMEIESVGLTTQCRVRTTVAPLGGSTIVTILYGAVCPAT